ncbi:MAG: c-type cytochrome biogenesis protein CcmI [Pseudomonadota bacterium]
MLVFWAVAGVLTAAAAGLILMRAAGAAETAATADPAPVLYRRQLAEIADLADRGLMGEAERKAAEAEAARRLLAATDAPKQTWNADPRARRVVLAAGVAAPAIALGLYLSLGAPGYPDQPFAQRLAGWRQTPLESLTPPQLAAVLRVATRERPTDAEGFRLLGMVEAAAQNPVASVRALRQAATLAPQRVDIWQMLGEAEIVEAGGKVDADAQAAFRKVLELSPKDPGARFYLANAKAEAGRKAEAVGDLEGLLAEMPASDPRRQVVANALADLKGQPQAKGDPQQLALIQGMVASLAGKLEADPNNPEGWVRLVRAYAVLGDTDKRDAAYASARARYAGTPQVLQQLDEAARAEPMR